MKKIFSIFLLLLVSCANHQGKGLRKNFVVPNIQTVGTENYLNGNSDYIFDQESLHTFELKIPGTSLRKIDSDPVKEEYVEGILIFEGDTLSPVGIRYKGSVGAFVGCTSGKNPLQPSGKKICTKRKPWLFIRNLLTRTLILKDIRKYIWFDINCISPFAYK